MGCKGGQPMAVDIVTIGASAGGVEAVMRLVRGLPDDLAAAIFIVVHIPADATGLLPSILARKTALQVQHARDGDAIQAGYIYIAPPDRHLMVAQGRMAVTAGPKENA